MESVGQFWFLAVSGDWRNRGLRLTTLLQDKCNTLSGERWAAGGLGGCWAQWAEWAGPGGVHKVAGKAKQLPDSPWPWSCGWTSSAGQTDKPD